MLNQAKIRKGFIVGTAFLLIGGAVKFYHYNYVANTRGQARALRLPGLKEFVCQGETHKPTQVDQCGRRSIYGDPDWGVTAYFIMYGIETREEAETIAKFMVEARKQSRQENIPMNLEVYTVPRSAGSSRPSQYKIYDQNL